MDKSLGGSSKLDDAQLLALLQETQPLRDQFVRPLYLSLLHANFIRGNMDRSEAIRTQLAETATSISDEQIRKLLQMPEWRGRLVAGWCIGLTRRTAFVDEVAELLIASRQTYAGQGYCVALGLIGDEQCSVHLQSYLREYLPPRGRIYDQLWAIGALAHINGKASEQFLALELWAADETGLDPAGGIRHFADLVADLTTHGVM